MYLKKTKKYKKISIFGIIILLGLGGYGVLAVTQELWPFNNNNVSYNVDPPSTEQREAGEEISQEAKEAEPESDQAFKQGHEDEVSNVSDVIIRITSTEQQNGQLQIRTLIHSVESGDCKLTLTSNSGTIITKSAATQSMAATSTCKGFDVPLSELANGEWQIAIDYQAQDVVGSVKGSVQIEQ